MRPEELKAFAHILTGLAEVLPKELSAVSIQLYFDALQGASLKQIKQATQGIIRQERYFPSPAIFLEYIRGLPLDNTALLPEESTMTLVERYQSFLVMKCVLENWSPDKTIPTRAQQKQFVVDHWNDDWKWRGISDTVVPLKDKEQT